MIDGTPSPSPSQSQAPLSFRWFQHDQLPHTDSEEEEDGEDLYNDNFMDDYRGMEEADQFESAGLDDRDFDHMMEDRRAAEVELDPRACNHNKLPQLLHGRGEKNR
ncbi:hypothetical protein RJT34_32336 [Clitoria ternatea]|uniref:Uncharacterized protein n=1 Tax=Clitoria ternatea TaxID=43366 RepID=A0AAN9EWS1_CLITE